MQQVRISEFGRSHDKTNITYLFSFEDGGNRIIPRQDAVMMLRRGQLTGVQAQTVSGITTIRTPAQGLIKWTT